MKQLMKNATPVKKSLYRGFLIGLVVIHTFTSTAFARRGTNPQWSLDNPEKSPWSRAVVDQIRKTDLTAANPRDVARYCPNFSSLSKEQKELFYLRMIYSMAEKESSHNPQEKFDDFVNGEWVKSSGLMQLSIRSARDPLYKCHWIRVQQDLLDPEKNLRCAVNIVDFLVKRHGVIYDSRPGRKKRVHLGAGKYWSTLRNHRKGDWIRSMTRELCRAMPTRAPVSPQPELVAAADVPIAQTPELPQMEPDRELVRTASAEPAVEPSQAEVNKPEPLPAPRSVSNPAMTMLPIVGVVGLGFIAMLLMPKNEPPQPAPTAPVAGIQD